MAFLELRDLDGTLGGTGVRLVLTGLSSSVRAHAEGSTWFSDWAASGHVFDTVEGALDALQDAPPQEEAP